MKKGIYLGIDTEFTGQHPHKHGLIEIALLALDANFEEIGSFQTLVKPADDIEITAESMKINNIDLSRLDMEGINYKELVRKITNFVRKYFADKPILFAHSIPMDFAYLNYIFDSVGKNTLFWRDLIGHSTLDTKVLANTINILTLKKGHEPLFPSTSLSSPGGLTDVLGITDYEAHTALGDIRATRQVLIKLLDILDEL